MGIVVFTLFSMFQNALNTELLQGLRWMKIRCFYPIYKLDNHPIWSGITPIRENHAIDLHKHTVQIKNNLDFLKSNTFKLTIKVGNHILCDLHP